MLAFLDRLRKETKMVGTTINFFGYFYLAWWNHFFNKVPSYLVRYWVAKYLYGLKIGKSNLHYNIFFLSPWRVRIGDNCNIQIGCFIDGRGGIEIGNNVDVTMGVKILSEQHDIDSPDYDTVMKKVIIRDNVVIGAFSLILPGATINEGAVIGAGSVVVKDVPEYCLAAGNPAIRKRDRKREIRYKLDYKRPFH